MSKVRVPKIQPLAKNTFYDPTDATYLYQDYELTSVRSRKFLQSRGFSDVPTEFKKSSSQPKMPLINDILKTDRTVDNAKSPTSQQDNPYTERIRSKPSLPFKLQPLESPKESTRMNKTPLKSPTAIDSVLVTPKHEISHIYKAMDEFKDLRTKSIVEQAPSRQKLTSDKFSMTAHHFTKMKNDISHIIDKKKTFHNWSSPKIVNYKELKTKMVQDLDHFVEDLKQKEFNSPKLNIVISPTDRADIVPGITENIAGFLDARRLKLSKSRDVTPNQRDSANNSFRKSYLDTDWLKEDAQAKREFDDYFKQPEDDNLFYQALKKEVPTAFTNAVASRHEVVQLGKWLSDTIEMVSNEKKFSSKEKLSKADTIYGMVLTELIRQVSNDCNERAELIKKIWKAYLNLTADIINDFKERDKLIESDWRNKLIKLEEKNVLLLTEKTEEISELIFKTNEVELEKSVLKERAIVAINREKEAIEENQRLKELNEKYKKAYSFSQKEIRDLEYKYQKLKKDMNGVSQQVSPDQSFDQDNISLDTSFTNKAQPRPTATFGLPKQTIVHKVDQDTSYQDPFYVEIIPTVYDAKQTQSDLTLIDKRYDRIFMDMMCINNILREDIIKEKLTREGDYLMNLLEDEHLNEDEINKLQHHVRAEQLVRKMRGDNKPEDSMDSSYFMDKSSSRREEKSVEASHSKDQTIDRSIKTPKNRLVGAVNKIIFLLKENKRASRNNLSPKNSKYASRGHSRSRPGINDELGENNEADEQTSPSKTHKSKKSVTIVEQKASPRDSPQENSKSALKLKSMVNKMDENKPKTVVTSLIDLDDNFNNEGRNSTELRNDQHGSNESIDHKGESGQEEAKEEFRKDTPKPKIPMFGIIHEDDREHETDLTQPPELTDDDKDTKSKSTPATLILPISLNNIEDNYSKSRSPELHEYEEMRTTNNNSRIGKANSISSIGEATPSARKKKMPLRSTTGLDTPVVRGIIKKEPTFQSSTKFVRSKGTSKTLLIGKTSKPEEPAEIESRFEAAIKRYDYADEIKTPNERTPKNADGLTPRARSGRRSKTIMNIQDPDQESEAAKQEERVIQYIKLYKIEKKNKDELANINKELEIRMIRDQKLISDLHEMIEKIHADHLDAEKLELMKKQLEKRRAHLEKLNNLRPGLTQDRDFNFDDDDEKIIMLTRNASLDTDFIETPPEPTLNEIPTERKEKTPVIMSRIITKTAQINERKNNPAISIIVKMRNNFQKKLLKMKTVFPLKSVLKQISGIYIERAHAVKDTPNIRDMDMASFVYKQFINMYGFQKFAIDKFIKFIMSVRKHSIVPRVFKFAKLIGMMEELQNYSFFEAKQYLLGMEYFNNNTTLGQNYIGADVDKHHYVVWTKAFDYARVFGEKKMSPGELADFRKDLEKLKVKDPGGKNDRYVVEIDEYLERIVTKYRVIASRNKDVWRIAFKGALVSHETKMRFIDFYNLVKYMEPEKFDEKKIEEIFINQCDIVEGEDLALGLERFVGICFELDMCSDQKQKTFIGALNEKEINDKFEDLKSKWADEHIRLNELIIQKKSNVGGDVVNYWRAGLESINNSFVYTENLTEKKHVLIRMKIIHLDILTSF